MVGMPSPSSVRFEPRVFERLSAFVAAAGRRARLVGGPDVWEVIGAIRSVRDLRRAHEAAGNEVPGLIHTSDIAFPRTKAYVPRLGAALAAAAAGREAARRGGVLWLRPPT